MYANDSNDYSPKSTSTYAGLDRTEDGPGLYQQSVREATFVVASSCRQRLDQKLWSSGPLHMQEKSMNHLRSDGLVSDTTLLVVRIVLWLLSTVPYCILMANFTYPFVFEFFTIWGLNVTELYFTLSLLAYIVRKCKGPPKEADKDPFSPWRLWKWVTFIFQTILLWELVITVVFWTILWKWTVEKYGD